MGWPNTDNFATENWATTCPPALHSYDPNLALGLAAFAQHLATNAQLASCAYNPAQRRHATSNHDGSWQNDRVHSAQHQRQQHRSDNDRQSGQVTAGLLLLLAICGWITGGDDGARRAVTSGLPSTPTLPPLPPEVMRQRYNARQLSQADAPDLFAALNDICRRAGIARTPAVYVIPDRYTMNAFAFGNRHNAAITVTQALLSGMSDDEVVAILAHEVAHIASEDGATMALAASLQRAISFAASSGLSHGNRSHGYGADITRSFVLSNAPAIGELLCLALSRLREYAADAAALDWIPDPCVLRSALEKLEHHHRLSSGRAMGFMETEPSDYVNSHPSTHHRLDLLRQLA